MPHNLGKHLNDATISMKLLISGDRLYWCDSTARTISSANTDGSDRVDLFSAPHEESLDMFGITLLHDRVFVTNWGNEEEGGR